MKTRYIIILYIIFTIFSSCNTEQIDQNLLTSSIKNQKKDLSAEETLKEFIYQLGNQNFEQAYKLTSNSEWKNSADFSSSSYFGKICGTTINYLKINSITDSTAEIYTEVFYKYENLKDTTLNQIFILKKEKKQWEIISLTNY